MTHRCALVVSPHDAAKVMSVTKVQSSVAPPLPLQRGAETVRLPIAAVPTCESGTATDMGLYDSHQLGCKSDAESTGPMFGLAHENACSASVEHVVAAATAEKE